MNKVLSTSITLLATLALAGCSNENDPAPATLPDAVELGITAGVSLTKSAIQGGNDAQSGDGPTVMQNIAVRATGDDYNAAGKNNDNAIYTQSGGTWTSVGTTNKIMLTSKVATIYAFHPAYQYDANGNIKTEAIEVTGTVGSNATIPVSVFEGGETGSSSPSMKTNSTITDADNSSDGTILSAPGEVDYLWEGSTSRPTASNGKASGATTTNQVTLNMKHALAMVSFRIYKEADFKGAGLLTKIKLENKSATVLNKGTSATMNIETGAVTVTGSTGATFTRFIKASGADTGVTIGSASRNSGDPGSGAHRYSILVFPESSTDKSTVQVTFTIDGADYPVVLSSSDQAWTAGNNYLYTAKLSGKALTIQSVKVAAWGNETGGSVEVN